MVKPKLSRCVMLAGILFLTGCQSDASSQKIMQQEVIVSDKVSKKSELENEEYKFVGLTGELFASVDIFPFDKLKGEADLIAEVKVIKKVGEIDLPTPKSIFELQVENVIEGDETKKYSSITVYQVGNSDWIYHEDKYTLESGNKYILFLKETINSDNSDYWILNEEAGLYQVLNENVIVNLAYNDEELNAISIDQSTINKQIVFNSLSESNADQEIQYFDREKFLRSVKEN
ncbi:hypothetical protein ABE096_21600 [Robertmurraya massiliosenegalensis]|uniref:hypothetical protein n=1 Tax=Robertmurraya TaxID=2837507 RepID=UPI0039A6BB11